MVLPFWAVAPKGSMSYAFTYWAAAPKGSITYAFTYGEFSSPYVHPSIRLGLKQISSSRSAVPILASGPHIWASGGTSGWPDIWTDGWRRKFPIYECIGHRPLQGCCPKVNCFRDFYI